MRVKCFCGIYYLNPENATYVKNGVPLCQQSTCQKVHEHRHLSRVPHFDDIEHETRVEEVRYAG